MGIICFTIILIYISLIFFIKKPLKIRGWEFEIPGLKLSIGQLLISSLDWAIAAGILYVLMPRGLELTYSKFLGIFLLAQIAGLLSSVPGGLGVFETIILLLMSDYGEPTAIMSSLLLYRVIYYILPLILASVLLGVNEFLSRRQFINQASLILGQLGKTVKTVTVKNGDTPLEKIEQIVRSSPKIYAWLALLGDKSFLFNESQTAFIMYAVQGRSWVAMGEPIGPEDKWQYLIWDFRELCDQYNGWPVFYQVDKEHLDLYLDLDLTFLKLGEEARVNLQEFSLSGAAHSGLRNSRNKVEKQNCKFSIVPSQNVPDIMPQLKDVSDQWLKEKKTREKKFSLGYFEPKYLAKTPVAIIHCFHPVIRPSCEN